MAREPGRYEGWPANHGIWRWGDEILVGFSSDQGKTWSDDIILRSDAVDWDLGYTRSVQRSDGRIVTVYYYNDGVSSERYIGSTIWTP